jgi:hypothetical protein
MAAGTAYRSAIAARMSSVRTVAKAISPGSRRRREDSDNERADDARAAVEGSEARCHAREELERVESRAEQQPAEAADACDTQNKSDDEMVDVFGRKGRTIAPSTTTTAHDGV